MLPAPRHETGMCDQLEAAVTLAVHLCNTNRCKQRVPGGTHKCLLAYCTHFQSYKSCALSGYSDSGSSYIIQQKNSQYQLPY
jgi:hypothetical protein